MYRQREVRDEFRSSNQQENWYYSVERQRKKNPPDQPESYCPGALTL